MWLPLAAGSLGGLAEAAQPGETPATTIALSLTPTAMFVDTMVWVALPRLGTDAEAHREWRFHLIPIYGASRGISQTLSRECPAGLGPDCLGWRVMLLGYSGLSLGSQVFAVGLAAAELGGPWRGVRPSRAARNAAALLAGGVLMDTLWWASLSGEPSGGGWGWHLVPIVGPIAGLSKAGALDCAGDVGCSSLRAATLSVSGISGSLELGAVVSAIALATRGEEKLQISPVPVGEGYGLALLGRW